MDDKIRAAIHELEGDYEGLGRLLDCYEAWGGRTRDDPGCGELIGPCTAEPGA